MNKHNSFTIILLAAFVFGLLLNVTQRSAYACSCAMPGPASDSLAQATAVFAGTVTDIQSRGNEFEVTFAVSEVWKGSNSTTHKVRTAGDSAACGYYFVDGESYLVYAHGTETRLGVGLCGRTSALAGNGDLSALGAGTVITADNAESPPIDIPPVFMIAGAVVAAAVIGIGVAWRRT